MLKIGHTVTVPNSLKGSATDSDSDVIPIPEELETVPGHPERPGDGQLLHPELPAGEREPHQLRLDLLVHQERRHERGVPRSPAPGPAHSGGRPASGDVEPTAEPVPGKDLTREIKQKALELGFAMVGHQRLRQRYTFKHKRSWVKPHPNAICLAVEQPYEETQMIPSETSEVAVLATLPQGRGQALKLAEYINTLGLSRPGAQLHRRRGGDHTHVRGGGHGPAGGHWDTCSSPTSAPDTA